jgi:hypothetical protein
MLGVFEFLITIIFLFLLVVYIIYIDIKKDISKKIEEKKKEEKIEERSSSQTSPVSESKQQTSSSSSVSSKCKNKCTKPTEITGSCYHPVKYNSALKKNQEVKSELICPWQCSSAYSDDPDTCRYDDDCGECSPTVSFPNIDNKCPTSKYGCCSNGITKKTDEFGNNCLGLTGATGATGATGIKEAFGNIQLGERSSPQTPPLNYEHGQVLLGELTNKHDSLILTNEYDSSQNMYPSCPNIHYPNENAFQKDKGKGDPLKPELGTVSWSVVTDYTS